MRIGLRTSIPISKGLARCLLSIVLCTGIICSACEQHHASTGPSFCRILTAVKKAESSNNNTQARTLSWQLQPLAPTLQIRDDFSKVLTASIAMRTFVRSSVGYRAIHSKNDQIASELFDTSARKLTKDSNSYCRLLSSQG